MSYRRDRYMLVWIWMKGRTQEFEIRGTVDSVSSGLFKLWFNLV